MVLRDENRRGQMRRRRVALAEGCYFIFYTFGEDAEELGESEAEAAGGENRRPGGEDAGRV